MLKIGIGVLLIAFCLIFVPLSGCGGGGETSSGTPALQSSLTTYDFGNVTLSNFPASKVVTIFNSGTASLQISNIELAGVDFILDLDTESNFCGSTTPTIAAGSSCDVAVGFGPTTIGLHHGTLSLYSNDPDTPIKDIGFTGNGVDITVPIVQINRVESDTCPSIAIYLSVMDQLGYPITGLTLSDFTITETSLGPEMPITTSQASVSAPMSVALVLDYSDSITDHPDVQAGMEAGVIRFINGLGANDEAEVIKFGSQVAVVQPFTAGDSAGKELLVASVTDIYDVGRDTRFNAAIYQAVDDLAPRTKDRKIMIVLSDGFNSYDPAPVHSYADAKNYAVEKEVHVFPIGIAQSEENLNAVLLQSLASDTGGQYFDTLVADDLNTIYQQLAKLLFVDQYLLTYDSVFVSGDSALLKVGVKLPANGNIGEDSRTIVLCP